MANKNFEVKHGLSVGGTERITAAGAGTLTNLTLSGNLTVQGTTVTLDASTLQVADKNIVLNYHASNDTSSASGGAGITIQDAVNGTTDATILWDASDDEFDFSHAINIPNLKVSGAQGTDGQLLTSTGSGVAWEDAPASGPTFKTFGTSSIMIGDTTTGTINAADYNTGLGVNVFENLTTGDKNTAVGYYTMGGRSSGSMTGSDNTAIGHEAMPRITSGQHNTSVGAFSGEYLSTGQGNTYIGFSAGYQNFTGSFNSVMGRSAFLYGNGSHNVSIGRRTLQNNGTKEYNTALGNYALSQVSTGGYNTGLGYEAGRHITTGSKNVVIGSYDGNENGLDIRTSSNNIVLSDGDANIRMHIDGSGNVGIGGTPDSSGRLLVTNGGTNQIVLKGASGSTNLNMGNFVGGGYISNNYYYSSGHQADDNSKGAFEIFIGDSNYAVNYHAAGAAGTRRRDFAIDNTGKVGIGIQTPGNSHANANMLVVGSGSAGGMALYNGANAGGYYFARDNANNTDAYDGGMSYDGSRNLKFHTNAGSTRMTIDGSGNVGIGYTTPYSKLWVEAAGIDTDNISFEDASSIAHLTVAGSNSHVRMQLGTMNASPYGVYIQVSYDNTPDASGTGSSGTEPILLNPKGGNVAVNVKSPQTPLHVGGTNNSAGDLYTAVGPGNCPSITIQNAGTTDNNNAALFFRDDAGMRASVGARFTNHSTNAAQLRFSTTDAAGNTRERVTIHETGQVTNPYQPSFMCYPANTYSQSAGSQKVSWTGESHDSNNEYNNATHRFTAPVAGRYLFMGELSLQVSTLAQAYMGIGIRINGSGNIYYGGWAAKTGAGSQYEKVTSTIIKQLAANDYVEIYVELASTTTVLGGADGIYSRFSGQLLS